MALMLCGSVTFVIGFILMPWVLGLVMIFYFFGLVSNLSGLGKAILLGNNSTGSERNEMPGAFFLFISIEKRSPFFFFKNLIVVSLLLDYLFFDWT